MQTSEINKSIIPARYHNLLVPIATANAAIDNTEYPHINASLAEYTFGQIRQTNSNAKGNAPVKTIRVSGLPSRQFDDIHNACAKENAMIPPVTLPMTTMNQSPIAAKTNPSAISFRRAFIRQVF